MKSLSDTPELDGYHLCLVVREPDPQAFNFLARANVEVTTASEPIEYFLDERTGVGPFKDLGQLIQEDNKVRICARAGVGIDELTYLATGLAIVEAEGWDTRNPAVHAGHLKSGKPCKWVTVVRPINERDLTMETFAATRTDTDLQPSELQVETPISLRAGQRREDAKLRGPSITASMQEDRPSNWWEDDDFDEDYDSLRPTADQARLLAAELFAAADLIRSQEQAASIIEEQAAPNANH